MIKSWLNRLRRLWRLVRVTNSRIIGIPFIALLLAGGGMLLAGTAPGRDLMLTLAEDERSIQKPVVFGLSALFLGLQAWVWSRTIITDSYGQDRQRWHPRGFLVWTPRALGLAPFIIACLALILSHAPHAGLILALAIMGVALLLFLMLRQLFLDWLEARARHSRLARAVNVIIPRQSQWFLRFSFVTAVVMMAMFIIWPVAPARWLGTAAVIFLGFGLIIPGVLVLVRASRRSRLPVVGGLLFAAILFSVWNDNHRVGRRAFSAEINQQPAERATIAQAFDQWAALQPSVPGRKIPILFVASAGGASRAGFWTSEILSSLHDETRGQFTQTLFAISSVSGASVGAAAFLGALGGADIPVRQLTSDFSRDDYLSPAAAGFLFPDLAQRFLPIRLFPDRAETLERGWEESWRTHCKAHACQDQDQFAQPFQSLWRDGVTGQWRPALLINGARQEDGKRIITSNLKILPTQILNALDFYDLTRREIATSTAVSNGARFPLVSPAGSLGPQRGHIVDGGYFENGGIETIAELARTVLAINRARGPRALNLQPIFIEIVNDDRLRPADMWRAPLPPTTGTNTGLAVVKDWPIANDVLAPLIGLYQSRDARGIHSAQRLAAAPVTDDTPYFTLRLCRINGRGTPMNWSLSKDAAKRITRALGSPREDPCGNRAKLAAIAKLVAPASPSAPGN